MLIALRMEDSDTHLFIRRLSQWLDWKLIFYTLSQPIEYFYTFSQLIEHLYTFSQLIEYFYSFS